MSPKVTCPSLRNVIVKLNCSFISRQFHYPPQRRVKDDLFRCIECPNRKKVILTWGISGSTAKHLEICLVLKGYPFNKQQFTESNRPTFPCCWLWKKQREFRQKNTSRPIFSLHYELWVTRKFNTKSWFISSLPQQTIGFDENEPTFLVKLWKWLSFWFYQ